MGHSCRAHSDPVGHTLRTRLPPKVTLRGCKTSVSYETSSKSHASSLKNERFERDFLQKSHVKSPKRAFRTRLPPKVTCQVPKTSVSYETSSKTHMSTTVSHEASSHNLPIPCACHESFRVHTSNAHKVLRLPRNVTSVTPRNLTIPCACHENRTSTPQKPHKVLRLPRKMTISSHVSFKKICTTTHVWNDFDPF